jgi:carboxyl-terminal processing protease
LSKKILYAVIITQALFLVSAVMISHTLGKAPAWNDDTKSFDFKLISYAKQCISENYRDKESIEQEKLMYGAIKGMAESLGDPYSQFLAPEMYKDTLDDTTGKFGGLGIEIGMTTVKGQDQLTVMSVFEGNPAHKVGVLPGDYIVEIDSKSTIGISLYEAKCKLRGEPGTKIEIKVEREHEENPIKFNIIRDVIKVKTVKYNIMDEIGYIRLTQFSDTTPKDFDKAIDIIESTKVKGIIMDLRSNPGGTLAAAVDVASVFLKAGQVVVSTKGRIQENNQEFRVQKGKRHTDLPLIVLTDRWSASGSEIVVGAIKDHKRGLIISTNDSTFGKGSVQTIFPMLDYKSGLKLTVAYYYTPSGENINKVGIKPDIKRPGLTTAETKMYQDLLSNKDVAAFVEKSGDNILVQLEGTKGTDREKFDELIKKLARENIKLDESLVKYAIAQKTKNEIDEYEYDPLIKFAKDRLKSGLVRL